MAKKFKLFLAAFVAVLTTGALPVSSAFADDDTYEKAPIHLQVSPTKQKISIAPGSSYVGTFTVMNVGYLPFNYSVYATPYSVTNEAYEPDYTSVARYSQISDWITFDKKTEKGVIQPGAQVEVAYTVNVPKNAPAGAQYAALMAQTEDGNDETANIQVVHRVGMILSATVPGETKAEGEIIKNSVNSFYFNPPLTVSSLVKNTGNIEQTATYTAKIYPLFSNEAVFSNEEKPDTLDIIPETSRFHSITWEGAPQIGVFSVEQTVEFAGEVSTNHKLVLICPLWLIFVIFALLFSIIFWLISRSRDRKRAKTRAAGKAKTENKSSSSSTKEKEE